MSSLGQQLGRGPNWSVWKTVVPGGTVHRTGSSRDGVRSMVVGERSIRLETVVIPRFVNCRGKYERSSGSIQVIRRPTDPYKPSVG